MKKKGLALSERSEPKGFSLIELLIAIAIMAVLMAIVLPNLIGSRERARDAKLKAEMNQLKSALGMYYGDYQRYPAPINVNVPGQWSFFGCGPTGILECKITPADYPCPNFWFAAGTGCSTIYMKKPPVPASSIAPLRYYGGGDSYAVCVDKLENASDPDAAISRDRCTGVASGWGLTAYCVCPD